MYRVVEINPAKLAADEQLGTKTKFWYDDPTYGISLLKIGRTGSGENWAEKACWHLATLLGIPAAEVHLALWQRSDKSEQGTLSPKFITEEDALHHGNELLEGRIEGYDRVKSRTSLHTVSAVLDVLADTRPHPLLQGVMSNAAEQFIGYLLFDAWIGNRDRHHENWGVVQPAGALPEARYLAPSYDHGSSLGRELTDAKRAAKMKASRAQSGDVTHWLEGYAQSARAVGRLFLNSTDDKGLTPIQAFLVASSFFTSAAGFWKGRLGSISKDRVEEVFALFPAEWLTAPARDFAVQLLDFNRKRLLNAMMP